MDDKDIICNFENLYKAYRKAKVGKRSNGSCARFQTMSLEGGAYVKGTARESNIQDEWI